MRIGQAVVSLGVDDRDDQDVVIAIPRNGSWAHYTLSQVADRELDGIANVYLASGTFRRGTVSKWSGRTEENLAEILWLPFDADLDSYLDLPKVELHAKSDAEIGEYVARLREDVEDICEVLGLPIHRMDYTGYGIAFYTRLDRDLATDISRVRAAHAAIVTRFNEVAGDPILDGQVKDAGTRVMRLPGCLNTKGAIPRTSATLYARDGAIAGTDLDRIAGAGRQRRAGTLVTVIPEHGRQLSDETVTAMVEAVGREYVEGSRHQVAVGIAGILAKAGVPETQALQIVERIADGDEELRDRTKAVETTYRRARSGAEYRGYFALREVLSDDLLVWLDRQLEELRQATAPRILTSSVRLGAGPAPRSAQLMTLPTEEARDELIEATFKPPPEQCYFGRFATYVEIMGTTTEACDQFHLASLLTVAGAMIGRGTSVRWFGEEVYSNLYVVLIGRTGRSRKDTAIKRALLTTQHQTERELVQMPFRVQRDVSSAEGLIQVLKTHANTLIYLSELTNLMKNARRKGTTTILDRMIEAWDTPDVLQNLNKTSPIEAHRPYLSVIAATQPSRLSDNLSDEDISSGFANRWLFVPGRPKARMSRAAEPDWKRTYEEVFLPLWNAIEARKGHRLHLSNDAGLRYDRWDEEVLAHPAADEAEEDMRARHSNLVIKIALIYAVSDRSDQIEVRHLDAAIALVDWMWGEVRQLMQFWGVGIDTQIANRILNQVSRRGAMKRRDLQRMTGSRKWGPREFASVFDAMVRNGTIAIDPAGWVGFPNEG